MKRIVYALVTLVAVFALVMIHAPIALLGALAVKATPALMLKITLGKLGAPAFIGQASATLVSKDRAATELRAQATKLRQEIMATDTPLTTDELKTKTDALKALEARAAVIAGFTGDDEINRQGGTGTEVTQMAGPENTSATRTADLARSPMADRLKDFSTRAKKEFGDVRTFLDVVVSGRPGRSDSVTETQKRLIDEARTLTRAIVGTTGDVSGGEFLLPLTQVQTIFSLANVQQGLLQRARAYNVPGRTLRIPYLIQTDEAASTTLDRPMAGQIANIAIVGEGSTKPARTPEFGQRLLTVYKYAAITQVSDEMLSDDFTGELPQEFINAVGQQALNKVNEDITINGSGTAEPSAALYAGAAWNISVNRNTGSSILPVDIFAMYARHTHGPNSVWFASRRTVQQLYNMSLTSASLVTFLRDLNQAPQMMLLGYPVILTDLLNTVGSAGDIALVNPDFYAFALRQALTVESSRDFAFTQDLTTYRFIVRAGGLSINTGKYAYKYAGSQGVDEHAPFVYLN